MKKAINTFVLIISLIIGTGLLIKLEIVFILIHLGLALLNKSEEVEIRSYRKTNKTIALKVINQIEEKGITETIDWIEIGREIERKW